MYPGIFLKGDAYDLVVSQVTLVLTLFFVSIPLPLCGALVILIRSYVATPLPQTG